MSSMSRTIRRSIKRAQNPQPRKYARRRKGHAWSERLTSFNPIQQVRQALHSLRIARKGNVEV